MKRQIISLVLAGALILSLCACSKNENADTTSQNGEAAVIDENTTESQSNSNENTGMELDFSFCEDFDWGLYGTNCNMVYYAECFITTYSLDFTLVSATPLTESDVQVSSDTGWSFVFYVDPFHYMEEKVFLYENIFLLTQGVSADEQDSFSAGRLSRERTAEIWSLLKAFRSLSEEEIPYLYHYDFHLIWNDISPNPDAVLEGIDMTVKGVTRHIDLGHISYCYDEPDFSYDLDFRLDRSDNVAYTGYPALITTDGRIEFRNLKYTAMADLTITGVRFYRNDEIEIQKISIAQEVDEDISVDIAWDGSDPLALSEGDVISLTVIATDPWFAGTAGGCKPEYLLVDYLLGDESYTVGIPFYCQQNLGDAFAYVALDAGYDVLPLYYQDN